jgi:hypothetical protein
MELTALKNRLSAQKVLAALDNRSSVVLLTYTSERLTVHLIDFSEDCHGFAAKIRLRRKCEYISMGRTIDMNVNNRMRSWTIGRIFQVTI